MATKECFCGCGTPTTWVFAPGHDAKFVFALLNEALPDDGRKIGERLADHFPEAAKTVQERHAGGRR